MHDDLAELQVGLMPIKPTATRNSTVDFKCEYNHPYTMKIHFELTSFNGLPMTAWVMDHSPIIPTKNGAYKTLRVHFGDYPCNVECYISDDYQTELAVISTMILPGWPNEIIFRSAYVFVRKFIVFC